MLAALLTQHNAPLSVVPVGFCGVDFGQVRVRVLTAGICGAQLQEIRGEKGGPLPHTLGHEGCGIVTEVGEGVTTVKEGYKVVLHWRKGAGIESEHPRFLIDKDGPLYTTGKVTTFAEEVVVSENRVTTVPPDTPADLAALLGCSLSTAIGTMENEAGLRFGQSILIVGCGGLGGALIKAARLAHAGRITVCDCHLKKEAFAHALGADEFYLSPSDVPNEDFDCVIDTTGDADALSDALDVLGPSGRAIMVGQPRPATTVKLLDARHFFDGEGKSLRATQGGGHRPHMDIPRYVELWRRGLLDYQPLISHRFPLARINDALALVQAGEAGRIILECSTE